MKQLIKNKNGCKNTCKIQRKRYCCCFKKIIRTPRSKKFAALTGAQVYTGRFIPGTFTNPEARNFQEPKILLVVDPITDFQAIKEACKIHIPIIALVGTDSPLTKIDLAIPTNNKGRKAIALVFYLLTRELLIARNEITKDAFTSEITDFEQEIEKKEEELPKRRFSNNRRRPRKTSKKTKTLNIQTKSKKKLYKKNKNLKKNKQNKKKLGKTKTIKKSHTKNPSPPLPLTFPKNA